MELTRIKNIGRFPIKSWLKLETFEQQAWLLVAGGLFVWMVTGLGLLQLVWEKREFYPPGTLPAMVVLLIALGIVFSLASNLCVELVTNHFEKNQFDTDSEPKLSSWIGYGALQYLLIICLAYLFSLHPRYEDMACIFLLLLSPQLALFVNLFTAFAIIAVLSIPLVLMTSNDSLLVLYSGYLVFHAIIVGFFHCILSEQRTKGELIKTNQKLIEAQLRLAHDVKQEERLRIARDLHDRVGHHLTALSIQLEVTKLLAEGEVLQEIQKSQSVAKELLNDVGEFRDSQNQSFADRIMALVNNLEQIVPGVQIEFNNNADEFSSNASTVDVLLLSLQELLTNALKHGTPSRIEIETDVLDGKLMLRTTDNGQLLRQDLPVSYEYTAGNGLTGLKERIAELKGSFETSLNASGFAATIVIPL